ncbi:MAG: hypothetical protein ABJB74_06140 [Gemmatimonas sp.]
MDAKAAAIGVFATALSTDPAVALLDLNTFDGLKGILGFTIAALARLPFDVKIANAKGFLATSQRSIIEQSEIVARITALEASQAERSSVINRS